MSSFISTTTAKTIHIKHVLKWKRILKERQSKRKLQPTYKPTKKSQIDVQKFNDLKMLNPST